MSGVIPNGLTVRGVGADGRVLLPAEIRQVILSEMSDTLFMLGDIDKNLRLFAVAERMTLVPRGNKLPIPVIAYVDLPRPAPWTDADMKWIQMYWMEIKLVLIVWSDSH